MKINVKNDILIANLNKEDFEDVFEVFKITIPFAFGEDEDGETKEAIDYEISEKKKLLIATLNNDMPGQIFLVAKYNGNIIGAIAYGPSGRAISICSNGELSNVGEVGSLFVLPQYHNNGVGTMLIQAMMKQLNNIGIEDFCLDSGYEEAQKRWIKKFGKPYAIVKDYWAEGVDNMVWHCKVKDYIG